MIFYFHSNYWVCSFFIRLYLVCLPSKSHTSYLLLYVDDIVLTASSQQFPYHIMSLLNREFSMTDLGLLHHFLGIPVTRDSGGLFLSLVENGPLVRTISPARGSGRD